MDIPNGNHDSRNGLAKMEDGDSSKNLSASKPDIKPPTRTLNRVPRTFHHHSTHYQHRFDLFYFTYRCLRRYLLFLVEV